MYNRFWLTIGQKKYRCIFAFTSVQPTAQTTLKKSLNVVTFTFENEIVHQYIKLSSISKTSSIWLGIGLGHPATSLLLQNPSMGDSQCLTMDGDREFNLHWGGGEVVVKVNYFELKKKGIIPSTRSKRRVVCLAVQTAKYVCNYVPSYLLNTGQILTNGISKLNYASAMIQAM